MRPYVWLSVGALLWAQKAASPPEKVVSYAVVGQLRDFKAGVAPSSERLETFSAVVLSKVGFYLVEGLSVSPEGELRCRLLVDPQVSPADLREVLRAAGLDVDYRAIDLTDEAAVRAMVQSLPPLAALVNNAGIFD